MFDTFKLIFAKMKNYFPVINKYRYFIGGLLVLLVFSFTILRIDSLASPSMNQERYDQGIIELKKVEFDTAAIERIDELQKTDVNIRENIDESRTNPF